MLKGWVGWPPNRPLPAVVEHGVQLRDDIWDVDRDAPLRTLLGCTPKRAAAYETAAGPGHVGVAIGPPVAYAASGPEPTLEAGSPGGPVVAFPAHSTHHISSVFDTGELLGALERIRARHDDVRVCLYWRDVLLGAAEAYAERGFPCVSAGHIYDPDFLPRLRRILDGAGAVVTNEVGSHLFYSVAMGRPVWLIEQAVDYVDSGGGELGRDAVLGHEVTEQAKRLFGPEERDTPTPDQREFVEAIAGVGHVRSRDELGRILASAGRRYRDAVGGTARALVAGRARARRAVTRALPRPR